MEKCYSCDNHGLIHKILTLPHPPLSLFPLDTGISFPEGSISKNFFLLNMPPTNHFASDFFFSVGKNLFEARGDRHVMLIQQTCDAIDAQRQLHHSVTS